MSEPALVDRLRSRAWRITPQRRAVTEALAGEHVHRTAEEVHEAARRIVPEISLATVYNTLNELVGMGEVAAIRMAGESVRYDPNVVEAHHHLVCESCRAIFDVHPAGIEALRLPDGERHGFEVEALEVVFRGRCATCSPS